MLEIIGKDAIVKTNLTEVFGRVLFYNGDNKITIERCGGEDEEGNDIPRLEIITSRDMVISIVE